jgi:hypothetical protein
MKSVKLIATMSVAACLLLFVSCNSGEEKKADETAVDSTSSKDSSSAVVAPATGPMMFMAIKHKVSNFAKWKPSYEAHDSIRLAHGLHNYVIARGIDDSNMVLVALRMDDADKAKELGNSPGMKERMKKAGVTGPVEITYGEMVLNDTTSISQTIRVMVKHRVKDWDAWKKVFDSHKQTRIDAGLTDRVISHAVGDDHEVTLVFAVADLAKAKALASSKELKDKMAEAGVEGPPSFFYYKIVAKY